jgi:hypothetical protein
MTLVVEQVQSGKVRRTPDIAQARRIEVAALLLTKGFRQAQLFAEKRLIVLVIQRRLASIRD